MAGNKLVTALEDLKPATVGLVKRGANLKRRFPVWKAHNEETLMKDMKEILEAVVDTEVDEEANLGKWIQKAQMSEKAQAAVKAALRILNAFKGELPKDTMMKLAEAAGYPSPEKYQKPEKAEKKTEKACDEDVMKSLPEDVRKQFEPILKAQQAEIETMRKANEEIAKALETERENREKAIWVAKAEKELSHVPNSTADDLGSTLHELHKIDPKLAEKQFATLKASSDAVEKSALLQTVGTSGGTATGNAWTEIEKLADGLVAKSDVGMTKAVAIDAVLRTAQGAKLYEQYLTENPKQIGA